MGDGRFAHQVVGGWAVPPSAAGEAVIPGFSAEVRGLDGDGGVGVQAGAGRRARSGIRRHRAAWGPEEVNLLLFSAPTAAGLASGPRRRTDIGLAATATQLTVPLGRRRLFNDFRIPAQPMDVAPV
jgi:hypothetical protein